MSRISGIPRRALLAILFMGVLGVVLSVPAFSYLPMFTRGQGAAHQDHWDFNAFPVTWSLNSTTHANISGTRSVGDVIQASFATWQAAPNASISVSPGPASTLTAAGFDGVNLICFVCAGDFSTNADTLAVTLTTSSDVPGQNTKHGGTSTFTGQLIDADILFNPNTQFTTGGGSAQDLQTIATHEIGHFFGLDHSPVVRAVMYPFAPNSLITLGSDDVAGLSLLYPKTTQDLPTGIVSGTVRFTSGGGVFGAHVFADSSTNSASFGGNVRKTPISSLTNPDGTYSISGLPIDSYVITAEPLDQPVDDSNISGFASAFAQSAVQTNFNTRWH